MMSFSTQPAPQIDTHLPAPGQRNGMALVILPGGSYRMLAEHEGQGYAEHFAAQGFTCFVVHYRLGSEGHRHPAMLEDALFAIASIRARAAEWGVDPQRIGVMGSSAGGHLAAHVLVGHGGYSQAVSLRPDFGVLCYPVITMSGAPAHAESRERLLGIAPSEAALREVSCELHVTPQTPPCFIWHTVADASVPVENSMLFASALRRHGVPFELHLYEQGAHGLGLDTELPWASDCWRWLRGR
jgi:acetyl esterase/lipase